MVVTAMLAWFNEQPETLHRAVTSLNVIADRLVAADGKWDLYPGESFSSPPEQAQAIREAAQHAGIDVDLWPAQPWTSQVTKRQFMLNRTAGYADWVLPLDSDWELQGDRDQIRAELEATTADALIVPFHTPANPDKPLDDAAATGWHRNMAGGTVHEPLIWRNLENMTVERFHWCIYGTRNGQKVSLWGNEGHVPQADTQRLQAPFQVTHWCLHRDQRTILANREYCERRTDYVDAHGTEPV